MFGLSLHKIIAYSSRFYFGGSLEYPRFILLQIFKFITFATLFAIFQQSINFPQTTYNIKYIVFILSSSINVRAKHALHVNISNHVIWVKAIFNKNMRWEPKNSISVVSCLKSTTYEIILRLKLQQESCPRCLYSLCSFLITTFYCSLS